MIQRCNAFVLSQPGVIKKGNCFFLRLCDYLLAKLLHSHVLMCIDQLERGLYMIASVLSPNGGARNHICFYLVNV